jgi:hypothetical protein
MFDGRYSLTRFSLQSAEDNESDILFTVEFVDTFSGLIGFGTDIEISAQYYDEFNGSFDLSVGLMYNLLLSDEFHVNSFYFYKYIFITNSFSDQFGAIARAIKDISEQTIFTDIFLPSVTICVNIYTLLDYSDYFGFLGLLGLDIPFSVLFSDMFISTISTVVLEQHTLNINAVIPPGGTIVIDSDNYNLYINGANSIDKHSGDWIFIDRDTISIDVSAGLSGNITGVATYNERFL